MIRFATPALACVATGFALAHADHASAVLVEATGVQDVFTRQSSSNGNTNYFDDSFLRIRQRSGTTLGLSQASTEMSWIQWDMGAAPGAITGATIYLTMDDGSGSGVTINADGDTFKVYLLKETHPEETTWIDDPVTGLGVAPDVLPPAKTVDSGGAPTGLDFSFLDEVAELTLTPSDDPGGTVTYNTVAFTLTPAGVALLNAKTHGLATFVFATGTDYDASGTNFRVRSFDNTLLGTDPNDPLIGIPAEYFPRLVLDVVPEPASAGLIAAGLLLVSRRLRR